MMQFNLNTVYYSQTTSQKRLICKALFALLKKSLKTQQFNNKIMYKMTNVYFCFAIAIIGVVTASLATRFYLLCFSQLYACKM